MDRAEKILASLQKDEDFNEGPDQSTEVQIKEGQKIEVKFRGNITFDDDCDGVQFIYNSNKSTAKTQVTYL